MALGLEKNKRFSSACMFPGNKRLPYCNTQIQYQKYKQIKVENIDCFRDKKNIKNFDNFSLIMRSSESQNKRRKIHSDV